MDSLELEARVEKSMDRLDHTLGQVLDIQHAEEDRHQEGDPQESVVD
jgi:hypothetical protein